MKTKLSFKRNKGLAAVGNPYPDVDIKIDGKVVGQISAPNWKTKDHKWGVSLVVEGQNEKEPNPNCSWHWVFLKERFDTEEAARAWLKENIDTIQKQWTLCFTVWD